MNTRRAASGRMLCLILAGCALILAACTAPPGNAPIRQGSASRPTDRPTASSPAVSPFPFTAPSGPSQPAGPCPFLTQGQVQEIVGQPIRQVKGCSYALASGLGSIGLLATSYTSPRQARGCITEGNLQVRNLYRGPGTRITAIGGLGGQAEVATLSRTGAIALLLRGARQLLAGLFWPPAATRPRLAVTLLRRAAENFSRYSAPPVAGCA